MHKKAANIIFVLFIAGLFWVISFFFNEALSQTMPRHQLIQLPAMLLTGIIAGFWFSTYFTIDVSWGIAIFIFVMASLIFWMLPHSIDKAVIDPSFNRIMHLNMAAAGLLVVPALRSMIFEVKIIFLGMLSAMIVATGIALTSFDILLCSAFDVFQQKSTGNKLIVIGIVLFAGTLFTFFRGLGVKPPQK